MINQYSPFILTSDGQPAIMYSNVIHFSNKPSSIHGAYYFFLAIHSFKADTSATHVLLRWLIWRILTTVHYSMCNAIIQNIGNGYWSVVPIWIINMKIISTVVTQLSLFAVHLVMILNGKPFTVHSSNQ